MKEDDAGLRVAKNSVALLASRVLVALTAVALATALPRYLGHSAYGLYSEVYAFVAVFEVIGQFGLRVVLTREVARNRQSAATVLGQVLLLKIPFALCAAGTIAAAACFRFASPATRCLIALCATESLVRGYSNTVNGVLRAYELMEYDLLITVVDRALATVAVLGAIWLDLGLTGVFAAFLAAGAGRLLAVTLLCLRTIGPPIWRASLTYWGWLVREAWPIGLGTMLERARDGIGVVLLGALGGATGTFAGALRITQLSSAMGAALADAFFPRLSRAGADPATKWVEVTRTGMSALTSVAFPVAAFYAVFGEQFVVWFLGPGFSEAGASLAILAPVLVLSYVRYHLSNSLAAGNRQRTGILASLVALIVSAVGSLLLIPYLDFVGASWALVASELAYLVTVLLFAGQVFSLKNVVTAALPAAAGTIGCLAAWWALRSETMWVRVPLGVGAYLSLWLALIGRDRELGPRYKALGRGAWRQVRAVLGKTLR